jgi:hypothetical protein
MISLFAGPFEYAKLMGQTEQSWQFKSIFRGLHWQILRTTLLLLPIFSTFDYLRRKTDLLKTWSGNFLVTFGVVGTSYICSWPVETLKNLSQSGVPFPNATVLERVNYLGGFWGLFRGVSPGTI